MPRSIMVWAALGALAVAAGVGVCLQREWGRQMQAELRQARGQRAERAALAEANRQLRGEQISPEELERLRADRVAVARLRRELSEMELAVKNAPPSAAPAPPPATAPNSIPSTSWKNVGRASPEATLETALWAAVGGDIDVLASAIVLSAEARQLALAVLAKLPPEARVQYATPERFAALFTARDVPLDSSLTLNPMKSAHEGEALLRVRLTGSQTVAGKTALVESKSTFLTLKRFEDGWKLQVPETAIQKYAAALFAPVAAPPAVK